MADENKTHDIYKTNSATPIITNIPNLNNYILRTNNTS